jgi:hypothetical protein
LGQTDGQQRHYKELPISELIGEVDSIQTAFDYPSVAESPLCVHSHAPSIQSNKRFFPEFPPIQWESQKNRSAFISFGKIQFYLLAFEFEISRSYRTASVWRIGAGSSVIKSTVARWQKFLPKKLKYRPKRQNFSIRGREGAKENLFFEDFKHCFKTVICMIAKLVFIECSKSHYHSTHLRKDIAAHGTTERSLLPDKSRLVNKILRYCERWTN